MFNVQNLVMLLPSLISMVQKYLEQYIEFIPYEDKTILKVKNNNLLAIVFEGDVLIGTDKTYTITGKPIHLNPFQKGDIFHTPFSRRIKNVTQKGKLQKKVHCNCH